MDKNLLPRILADDFQKARENLVMRERTVPWNRNILHSEAANLFALGFAAVAPVIDNNINPAFGQVFEAAAGRLRSAKKRGRDFTEIAHAVHFSSFAKGARRGR